jgi:hypothetical protein
MTVILSPVILRERESNTLFPLRVYTPETYELLIQPNGNSLLSSLLVLELDPGASVTVNYWQTTSGNEIEERTDLTGHGTISVTDTAANQTLVTRIHNKVYAEVIVTGGNARFGIYGSVVSSFATDLEAALKKDGQPSDLPNDRGLPIVVLNTTTGEYEIWEGEDGVPAVRLLGDVQVNLASVTTPTVLNIALVDDSTEATVTIPTGTRQFSMKTRSGSPARLAVTSGGTLTEYVTTGAYEMNNLAATASVVLYALGTRPLGDVLEVLAWS